MNLKANMALFFAFASFVLCIYLVVRKSESKVADDKKASQNPEKVNDQPAAAPIEIAHFMNRIQVFHNKLYFSGKAGNKTLSLFYLDEMEEEMGMIAEAGIFEVDVDISENIQTFGLKQVDWMRKKIEKDFTTFETDFEQLSASCNGCHLATKKDFIKIITPTAPIFSNQDYLP